MFSYFKNTLFFSITAGHLLFALSSWAAPVFAAQARVAPTITGYQLINLRSPTPALAFQLEFAKYKTCYAGTYLYHHIANYPQDITAWSGYYTWPLNICGVPTNVPYKFGADAYAVLQCPAGYFLTSDTIYIGSPVTSYHKEYYCQPNAAPQKTIGAERCTVGNPCDPLTGNKSHKDIDYTGTGAFPLIFERIYNSLDTGNTERLPATTPPAPRKTLGANWKSNYSGFIEHLYYPDTFTMEFLHLQNPLMETAAVHRPDGKVVYFTSYNGGNAWIPDSDVNDRLERSGGGWLYTLRDGSEEAYNSAGQLTQIRNRAGLTKILNYNSQGLLASVTDSFGLVLTFTYNAQGNISSLTDPAGRVLAYTYDSSGEIEKLIQVTYADGTAKLYHYENISAPNFLTGISFANSSGTATRYSTYLYEGSRVISTEHAGGIDKFTFSYSYNTVVTDAIGTKEEWNFSRILGVPMLTSKKNLSDNKAIIQTFDANHNLTRRTEEGRTTAYTYNTVNQRLSMTEASGSALARTTTYQYLSTNLDLPTLIQSPSVAGGANTKQVSIVYDAQRNPAVITQSGFTPSGAAVSRSITLGYNATGQVTSIDGPRTDVADVTSISYYNCTTGGACGQIQSVTNAHGQTTRYDSYDANGRVLGITDPNGLRTIYSYDPRGRVTAITQSEPMGASRVTQYGYDTAGNVTFVGLPTGLSLSYTYDAALKLRRVTDSLGNRVDYNYDLKGNRTQAYTYDPAGTLTRAIDLAYDARNRVSQINTGGSVTKQVWDAVGNLTRITDPNTVAKNSTTATANSYDGLNRLFKTVDLLYGNTQYSYDVNDRMKTAQAPNSATTTYAYDDLGNLLSEVSPDRGTLTYSYDAVGNVISLRDARGITVGYSYDALNRLTNVTYPDTNENIAYHYDNCTLGVGRLCRVQDAAGASDYSYDGFGNVASHRRTELGVAYTTGYGYDPGNRVTSITYPNGRQVSYTRDTRGNIQAAGMSLNGVSTSLVSDGVFLPDGLPSTRRFGNGLTDIRAYDTQGKLRELYLGSVDTRLYAYDANGNLTGKQSLPEVGAYTYDALDRLKQEIRTTQAATTTNWTYDANGNRKTQNTGTYAYLAASNRLTTAPGGGISLDAAGNTLSDGTRSYTYNNAGHLSNVAGAGYSYNAQRQRSRKIVGSQATVYHYDLAGNLIAETDADGNLIRDYVWLDAMPVAQVEAGETITYLHTDHLNTPRLGTDAQGQVVWRWDGTAFGESAPAGSRTVNLRFPGQYYDAETGLHYNWNRYYDPRIGRYLSSDPIGLVAGVNTYVYVRNNPLRFFDRTGLDICTISQADRRLVCTDAIGDSYVDTTIYSGTGAGRNNPDMQNVPDFGPIPRGCWKVGWPTDSRGTGPHSLPLMPLPGNDVFNTSRDPFSFLIHGESTDPNRAGNASKGCPIADRPSREKIPLWVEICVGR